MYGTANRAWYKRWWGIILAIPIIITTWPFLLIYWLIWKKGTHLPVVVKIIASGVLLALYFALAGAVLDSQRQSNSHAGVSKPASGNNASTIQAQPSKLSIAQQVTAWNNKYGYIITTLEGDYSTWSINGTTNLATANAECKTIQSHIDTARNFPDVPDTHTNSDWVSGFISFSDGAQDCLNGIAQHNNSWVSLASTEFSDGNAKLTAVVADIKALIGQ